MDLYRVNLLIDTPAAKTLFLQKNIRSSGPRLFTDPLVLLALLALACTSAFIGYKEYQVNKRYEALLAEVRSGLDVARRMDTEIRVANDLRIRRGEIMNRIEIVRSVDAGRFIWSHILDEVARTIPEDMWLERMEEKGLVSGSEHNVVFEIEGKAANTTKVTEFIRVLEVSPFIAQVEFTSSKNVTIADQQVVSFVITAKTEDPDPTLLEMEAFTDASKARAQERVSPTQAENLPDAPPLGPEKASSDTTKKETSPS